MKLLSPKKYGAGFWLSAVALALSLTALVLYLCVCKIFRNDIDRWAFTMSFIACWCLAFYLVNTMFVGDSPFWASYVQPFVPFLLLLSGLLAFNPRISDIAIYFTVTMGDVATMRAGVPPSIAMIALYLTATAVSVAAGFYACVKEEKGGQAQ